MSNKGLETNGSSVLQMLLWDIPTPPLADQKKTRHQHEQFPRSADKDWIICLMICCKGQSHGCAERFPQEQRHRPHHGSATFKHLAGALKCVRSECGCRVKPPAASHDNLRTPTCTFQGPGVSNTTKIPREDPPQREERMKFPAGEKNSAKIWAPPPIGAPPFGAPPFWAPPFWAPPFGCSFFHAFSVICCLLFCFVLLWPHPSSPHPPGPHFNRVGALRAPTPSGPTKNKKLAKFGQIRLAKCGQLTLAKCGIGQIRFGQMRPHKDGQIRFGKMRSRPSPSKPLRRLATFLYARGTTPNIQV